MIDLAKYTGMKICAAVSGGRDSMALLHYLYIHAGEYSISLSVLNCDHGMRGEASARDSAFVKAWCAERNIPVTFFEWTEAVRKTETSARLWRLKCYEEAIKRGADAVATAHHLNDNAETVLFNLARGSSLSGLCGITDTDRIIRPLINCTRAQIDEYVVKNSVPYVDDQTNFTDDYTRNKIRHNVLPELERAVPEASKAIYRFSRLAADDEKYFDGVVENLKIIKKTPFGTELARCTEKVIFRRAAARAVKGFGKKDYTFEQIENLYNLQFSGCGKRFEFLGLTAYNEEGKIVLCEQLKQTQPQIPFREFKGETFCGQQFIICGSPENHSGKILKFDARAIPETAVIRFMREGDKFTKFGGGTKNLGDYFTDKKIPLRLRKIIPLIADGGKILAVGGIEISDEIKLNDKTENITYLVCSDYTALR